MTVVGRVAIVTGGARGIGRAISLALAREGTAVAVVDVRSPLDTVSEIGSAGGNALALVADVTQDAEVVKAVDETLAAFGKVDILVSNAGVPSQGKAVVDTEIAEAQRLFDVHALGAMRFTKLVVPLMRQQPRGDIIYVSSQATAIFRPLGAPYVMAKAALEGMARTLAKEEREQNIRVNVVAPGITETAMGTRMVKARFGITDVRDAYSQMPFGRMGQPDDIAGMVAYLVSERGSYITGQVFYVNGGGW